MISFKPLLSVLQAQGKTRSYLKTSKIISGGTYTTLASAMDHPVKEGISISAIDRICAALNCQPGDILEYVPDEE